MTIAREALKDGRPDDARVAVAALGRETARARSLTGDVIWRAAAAVPYAGVTLKTVRDLAAATDDLARVVLPDAVAASEALTPSTLRRTDGTFALDRLRTGTPLIRQSSAAVSSVRDRLDAPDAAVVRVVAEARRELADQVAELADLLESADQALTLAPSLLGADRPRRFMVLIQQTAESRGTGGLPGGFVVLEAAKGRVRMVASGSNNSLRNGMIAPPRGVSTDYVDRYGQEGAFELWQNVNLSADLPTVSKVVAARWQAQGGSRLDGVIIADAVALAAILRGTPPLRIAGRRVPPAQLVDYLAVGQYRDFPALIENRQRKDGLSDVAAAAAARITGAGGDTRALFRGLVEAVRSGHLRMASDDPGLQPGLRAAGVDGALPTGPAPVAFPIVYNASGGKLDHFLDRSVTYTASACVGDRRRSTISVRLTNRAPASGLPPYTTIRVVDGRFTQSSQSAVVLQVYATPGAALTSATLDGSPVTLVPRGSAPFLSHTVEGGLPLWYLYLDLPRAKTRELVLQLDEPVAPGRARVPVQPLSRPLDVKVDVPACASR